MCWDAVSVAEVQLCNMNVHACEIASTSRDCGASKHQSFYRNSGKRSRAPRNTACMHVCVFA